MITYLILILVGVAITAASAGAFFKGKRHKQKQLRIANSYKRFITQFKLAIDYSEFLNYRFIGLDRKNRELILIDHCGNKIQEECISLYEIGESKIIQAKDESLNTKSIILELKNRLNDHCVQFCFYDSDHDLKVEMPSLFRKAIQWKSKVDLHKHRGNIYMESQYIL